MGVMRFRRVCIALGFAEGEAQGDPPEAGLVVKGF